jgi:hypothetical protein
VELYFYSPNTPSWRGTQLSYYGRGKRFEPEVHNHRSDMTNIKVEFDCPGNHERVKSTSLTVLFTERWMMTEWKDGIRGEKCRG